MGYLQRLQAAPDDESRHQVVRDFTNEFGTIMVAAGLPPRCGEINGAWVPFAGVGPVGERLAEISQADPELGVRAATLAGDILACVNFMANNGGQATKPEAPAPAKARVQEALSNIAIKVAMHTYSDADERIEEFRAEAHTNKEVKQFIGERFNVQGGVSTDAHSIQWWGGKNPKVTWRDVAAGTEGEIKGAKLVEAVRGIYNIAEYETRIIDPAQRSEPDVEPTVPADEPAYDQRLADGFNQFDDDEKATTTDRRIIETKYLPEMRSVPSRPAAEPGTRIELDPEAEVNRDLPVIIAADDLERAVSLLFAAKANRADTLKELNDEVKQAEEHLHAMLRARQADRDQHRLAFYRETPAPTEEAAEAALEAAAEEPEAVEAPETAPDEEPPDGATNSEPEPTEPPEPQGEAISAVGAPLTSCPRCAGAPDRACELCLGEGVLFAIRPSDSQGLLRCYACGKARQFWSFVTKNDGTRGHVCAGCRAKGRRLEVQSA